MLEKATAAAIKRVIAGQIESEVKPIKLTKTALARKMRTSRAAISGRRQEKIQFELLPR